MPISDDEAMDLAKRHEQYVEKVRPTVEAYEATYGDDFWQVGRSGEASARHGVMSSYPVKMQVNTIQGYIHSHVAALFHKSLRTTVGAPILPMGPHEAVSTDEAGGEKSPSERVAALLDLWLSQSDVEAVAERLFIMSMLQPEVALKLVTVPNPHRHPLLNISIEALPYYECVWDREARNAKDMRYIGHMYYMPEHTARAKFGLNKSDIDPVLQANVTEQSFFNPATRSSDTADADRHYVRVMELYDLTDEFTLTTQVDGVSKKMSMPGRASVYLLEGGARERVKAKPVHVGPIPHMHVGGDPAPPIQPVILLNHPTYPLQGIIPAGGQYTLSSETNYLHTFLVNAARRDSSRKLMYRKGELGDEELEQLTNGHDMELVGIDSQGPLELVAKWLEQQPVSPTISDLISRLENARQTTQNLSPLQRGEALKYSTAKEVQALSEYSESTLGRLRKRMDAAIVKTLQLFMRVLDDQMSDQGIPSFSMLVQGKTVSISQDHLRQNWQLGLADSQMTPAAQAKSRNTLLVVQPILTALRAQVVAGDQFAAELLRYVVEAFELPPKLATIGVDPTTAPPPAPLPGPGPGPGPGAEVPEGEVGGPIFGPAGGAPLPGTMPATMPGVS